LRAGWLSGLQQHCRALRSPCGCGGALARTEPAGGL